MQPGDRLFSWCHTVLVAVQDYAITVPAWPLPDRQLVTMGAPAWDCELLAVWCEQTVGYEGDVTTALAGPLDPQAGRSMRVATLGVSIVRCAPDASELDLDELPSVASVQAVAELVYPDQAHVMNALLEATSAGKFGPHNWAPLTWTPEGPDGGFAGSTLRLAAGLIMIFP